MKNVFLAFLLLSITTQLAAQMQGEAQTWVILSDVKESAKTDYEKWMTDVFFEPMKASKDPVLKQQFSSARWQKPVRQNDDKTWTYCILLDPAIPNADYGIEPFLVKTYGEAKGKNYMKQYDGFMATAGQIHYFEMSKGLTTPSVKEDEEAIKKVIISETETFREGNIEAYMAHYAKESYAFWSVTNGMEPGDVIAFRGYDALKAFIEKLPWFANYNPTTAKGADMSGLSRDNWIIQLRGNIAYVSFNEHSEDTAKQTKIDIINTRVLERINRQWKITMLTALADFKDATPPIRSKY